MQRSERSTLRLVSVVALSLLCTGSAVHAATLRLWPTAVVVSDTIYLSDLCELRGFDPSSEQQLSSLIVGDAPAAGGSRVIHLEMIRAALTSQGINIGGVAMGGAIRCEVRRPLVSDAASGRDSLSRVQGTPAADDQLSASLSSRSTSGGASSSSSGGAGALGVFGESSDDAAPTLRRAVIEHFMERTARYHGTAELVFDRTDDHVLEISGPKFTFNVRSRDDDDFGMVPLEVDVVTNKRIEQTIPLVVQASLVRPTVVARRAINQGAAIQQADIETMPMRYTTVSRLGFDDETHVVGQQARRLIRAGTRIEPDVLEQVPLVQRGQLVSVTSVVGGISVVTSGKAASNGKLGDVVSVRTTDRGKAEMDAVVVGPGRVQIGGSLPAQLMASTQTGSGS